LNRAYAENASLNLRSNVAAAKVEIRGGVFADDGILFGKVWADCDCDTNRSQHAGELGVPGVRVYLEDGRSSITDSEGKYHFEAVDPRLHTVKLDRSTLPVGARPLALDSRDAEGAGSRFADVKQGEMFRADFPLAGCDAAMIAELRARRELGEVRAALETAQPTLSANVTPGRDPRARRPRVGRRRRAAKRRRCVLPPRAAGFAQRRELERAGRPGHAGPPCRRRAARAGRIVGLGPAPARAGRRPDARSR
jgi:hypothetical protein